MSYDEWFRAKVQEALDDARPATPDNEVKAEFSEERKRLGAYPISGFTLGPEFWEELPKGWEGESE